jgi:hypothetical protein
MPKLLLAVLVLMVLPSSANAEPGGRGDLDWVRLEVEAMQRDGCWQQLIAEGRANSQAFGEQRQGAQPVKSPTATGSSRVRSRR